MNDENVAKLIKIHIKNYKSLVDTSLDIQSNPIVIVGKNGAGKTNILTGISLLNRGLDYLSGLRFSKRKYITDATASQVVADFKFKAKNFRVTLDVYFDEFEQDNIEAARLFIKNIDVKSKREEIRPEAFQVLEHFNGKPSASLRKRYLPESKDIISFLPYFKAYTDNIKYISSTQFSEPSSSPISFENKDGKLGKSYGRYSKYHEEFLSDLYVEESNKTKSFKLFINVVGRMGLCLIDDAKFEKYKVPYTNLKVRPGGEPYKIDIEREFVVPKFYVNDLVLSPSQFSEGTLKTIAQVFYIVRERNELLLIEEPEIGVHYGLLKGVVDLISQMSDMKQIFLSTHSDTVVDMVDPSNLVLVSSGKKGTKAKYLSNAMGKNDLAALHEYLKSTGNLGDYWKETGFEGYL